MPSQSPVVDAERTINADGLSIPSRVLFLDEKKTNPEFGLENVRNPRSIQLAQTLKQTDIDRFEKYRNMFKNRDTKLAREIQSKTSKTKAELLLWLQESFGTINAGEKYTKAELVELAIVSAAISKYGEQDLSNRYESGEFDSLPNTALHTHDLRYQSKQQACRDKSKSTRKGQQQAAHYIGLEVMLKLNERLPEEHRVGDELRTILNHPNNFRLVLTETNQVFHKKVDALLISTNPIAPEKLSSKEYARLVQIAKRAQSSQFQEAMINVNGKHLYNSLRDCLTRFESKNRPKIWDGRKDRRQLRQDKIATSNVTVDVEVEGDSVAVSSITAVATRTTNVNVSNSLSTDNEGKRNQRNGGKRNKAGSGGFTNSTGRRTPSTSAATAARLKSDGTPDMRYRENKERKQPAAATTTRNAGSGVTTDRHSKLQTVYVKSDSIPDRRYKEKRVPPNVPSASLASLESSSSAVSSPASRVTCIEYELADSPWRRSTHATTSMTRGHERNQKSRKDICCCIVQ